MPKIGLILECGPKGPDQLVCEHLLHELNPNIQAVSRTLWDKPRLLNDCGQAAAALLEGGCERVIIVWDLYPVWKESRPPCRRSDREMILASLANHDVPLSAAHLVCIQAELEAWLLSDERALATVIGSKEHPVRVPREKKPEENPNPKGKLRRLFEEHGRQYSEFVHAKQIVEALPNLKRIKRCRSFVRFALKAANLESNQY